MTNGQIQQLRDLSKCYMPRGAKAFVMIWLDPFWTDRDGERMSKSNKATLRRLTHQYRGQIAAIKRNQRKAAV
jgi:hypothetical protein